MGGGEELHRQEEREGAKWLHRQGHRERSRKHKGQVMQVKGIGEKTIAVAYNLLAEFKKKRKKKERRWRRREPSLVVTKPPVFSPPALMVWSSREWTTHPPQWIMVYSQLE